MVEKSNSVCGYRIIESGEDEQTREIYDRVDSVCSIPKKKVFVSKKIIESGSLAREDIEQAIGIVKYPLTPIEKGYQRNLHKKLGAMNLKKEVLIQRIAELFGITDNVIERCKPYAQTVPLNTIEELFEVYSTLKNTFGNEISDYMFQLPKSRFLE